MLKFVDDTVKNSREVYRMDEPHTMSFLDDLLALPRLFGAKVSPDGRYVAWSWNNLHETTEVYVAPTDGSAPPTRLTDTSENTYLVDWAPDSEAVIVMQDHAGDERFQLFLVELEAPLTLIRLTEPDPNFFIRGGQLHPSLPYIVYGANYDPDEEVEIEPTWIIRENIQDGERVVLARPEKGGYVEPMLSPNGQWVLYNRMDKHPAGRQLWLVDIEGKKDYEIFSAGDDKKAFGEWFPDSQQIVIRAETDTQTKVGVYNIATGHIEWVLDDPLRNIEAAFVPYNSEEIVLWEVREARLIGSRLHPMTKKETFFPELKGNLVPLAPVGTDWICTYYSSTQPTDIIRLRPDGSFISISRIWEHTPLRESDFTPAQSFRWTSVDGLSIHGWLYLPKGEPKGTVVYVHGGPTSHSQDHINPQIQYLVSEGFVVLDPNYRGSTGYSLEYRQKIIETGWGGLEQEDIRTGIVALIEQGIAQRGRIGMTGTSYGGYSSWCGITRFDPDTLAASAPICGMTDLVVDYETTRPDLRPYSEEMMGGRPDEVPERYYERSPIHFVQNIQGRLLIVQGLQDPNVSPENVRTVTEALQKAGIEYELLAFADEGHGIRKPKNQRRLYEYLAQFFKNAFDN